MCIIVVKEKGKKLPSKEILENCFYNNNDGAGFMYVKDKKVVIDKGYMSFKDFYRRLQELNKMFNLNDKALIMHFRIGTSGTGKENLTHPFPLTNKRKHLNKTYYKCNLGIVHNGIISEYTYDENLSDTQTFIKDYLYPISKLSSDFYKYDDILKIIKNACGSKICLLDKDENIYYIGEYVYENGIIYSNNSYDHRRYFYKYDTYTSTKKNKVNTKTSLAS